MIDTAAIAGCQWREPGGAAAAQAIATFLDSIGIAMLAWYGMTAEKGVEPFPAMHRWLR